MSNDDAWVLALIIGLAAALIVAVLLLAAHPRLPGHRVLRRRAARRGRQGRGQHRQHPALAATAPVLGKIVDEAIVQDGYMNALTDGFGGK